MTSASRPSLQAARLKALVDFQWGATDRERADYPGGAGLLAGEVAWVLADADPLRALGPALVWAERRDASTVHLLVDDDAEVLARRATCFAPSPVIWLIDGTTLRRAVAAPPAVLHPAPSSPELAELLVDADLEVIVEGGIVRGEVRGLEVARIVHGSTSAGVPIDEPLLEVGVGHADRELTAMLHGSLSPTDQLARVVEIVRRHRRIGAERHPLNQLAPERWLRSCLVADPGRLGLTSLAPIAPAVDRRNLRDSAVAMARGETAGGASAIVACSVGVDLDLVPAAADTRLAADPEARLLLVMPERDAHSVTRMLAARLSAPAEVIAIDDDWRC